MRDYKVLVKIVLSYAIVGGIIYALSMTTSLFVTLLIGMFSTIITSLLLIYLVLAPENLFFTFVPENKVKFIISGGRLQKILASSNQYTLHPGNAQFDKYDVVRGESKGLLGGLRFYGFWPLSDVMIYRFKWTNITESGVISEHDEILDTMILKTDMYLVKVTDAEDKNMIPMDIKAILTIRIVNPYKAMYMAQNWLENIVNIIKPAVREQVRKYSYEELIKGDGEHFSLLGKNIFNELRGGVPNDIEELYAKYGIELSSIRIENIDPQAGLRELTLKKIVAEKEAEVKKITASADAEAFKEKALAWKQQGVDPGLGLTLEKLEDTALNYTVFGGGVPEFFKKFFNK